MPSRPLPNARRAPRAALAALLLPLLGAGACSTRTAAPAAAASAPGPALDRALAAITFDSAWRRVRDSYYDPQMRGVDWDAVRTELRPQAIAARTQPELRVVLQRMLDRLGESHFTVIPGELAAGIEGAPGPEDATAPAAPGDVGMWVRMVDDRVMVTGVAADGPAAAAGIRPGWTLDVAAGDSAAPTLRLLGAAPDEPTRRELRLRLPLRLASRLTGPAGSTVRVTVRDLDDRPRVVEMLRRRAPGALVRFGNLPPTLAYVNHLRLPDGGSCVGYVSFNSWMIPLTQAIESAVDAVRDCRGIVVDLRGNLGGVAGMVMGFAGHFLDEPHALGILRTRAGEARFVANPRRVTSGGMATSPYDGPVAVLVDRQSASTTEFFAAAMRHTGRARLFGDTTAGKALPAALVRLPNGDALMHVVADFTTPDGARLEGHGVAPDEVVPLTRTDLAAGRDRALESAIAWITSDAPRVRGADTSRTKEH